MKAFNSPSSSFAISLWMLGAIIAFTLTAVAGKEVASLLSVSQLILYRNICGLLLLVILFKRIRPNAFRTSHKKLHGLRNSTHFFGQWCWFYGIAMLPLANVFAIEFTVPIWTAIFAWLLLSEQFTKGRVAATILGFIGVLVILRPGIQIIDSASWVVLFGALGYAMAHTMTKKLAGKDDVYTLLFYMHLMQLPLACLVFGLDLYFNASSRLELPNNRTLMFIVITAVAAILAHFCMAKALSKGDAMLVMPIDFLRLPLAALVGWLVYQEAVDIWLVVGAVIMLLGNMLALKEKPANQKG